MAATAPTVDPEALERARTLVMRRASRPERMWPVLAAASALAVSALAFATVTVTAPPLTHEHPGQARSIE